MVMRTVESTLLAEISKSHFWPVFLVWIDWPGDPVRAHSGVGEISFDGHAWAGVGRFAMVSLPEEEEGIAQSQASFGLVGIPDDIAALFGAAERDMACAVWFGAVTTRAGNTLVGMPFEVFRGRATEMRERLVRTDRGRSVAATLVARTGPSQRVRAGLFHTLEQHLQQSPGDTLFRHAAGTEDAFRRGIDEE